MRYHIFLAIYYVNQLEKKWRKECNFDCSKCKVWDCNVFNCEKYKKNID